MLEPYLTPHTPPLEFWCYLQKTLLILEHGITRFNQQAFWQRKILVLKLISYFEIT